MARALAVAGLLALSGGCVCGPRLEAQDDGGVDAGADAGVDAGRRDAGGVTLPIFRIGPRSAFQGSYGPSMLTGSIELPLTARTPAGFGGWEISSPVARASPTMTVAAGDGGSRRSDFVVLVSTASSAPRQAREVFTASSADAGTVLLAVLDAQGELHFTLESSALQALAKHEVRADEPILFEAYYWGAAPTDRPELDAHVPVVAASMRQRLGDDGTTGLSEHGYATAGSPLFVVIDGARANQGAASQPRVTPGGSGLHLTEVELSGAAGTLALFAGPQVPQPAMAIAAGTTRVALFTYSFELGARPLWVKQATVDGGQSPASRSFVLPEPLGVGPDAPTLTLDAAAATACGLTAGHHVVFFSSGTELAIGFAQAPVLADGGCAALPRGQIPAGVSLLTAAQVDPDGRVGSPSPSVFP